MQSRTLLILTILVALMGAYIFFFEKNTLSTDERREQEKKVLVFEEDDVRALEIEAEGRSVRFERRDPPAETEEEKQDKEKGDIFAEPEPTWELVEPLRARADKAEVTGLLTTLAGLEKSRTIEDADRAQLGLDEPRGRVTLTTDDGDQVLEIGLEVPASSDMAVAAGGAVHIVSDSVWSDLTKEPGDWRDKKLFSASRSRIDRITLRAGDSRVLLAKRGEDFWIESPLTDLADGDLVNGLLSEITGLEVESFVDDPETSPAELGLKGASKVVEVVLAGQADPFRLELGNAVGGDSTEGEPTLYARNAGQVVEIETKLLESLTRTPREWLSRDWTPLQPFRVQSGSFEDSDGAVDVKMVDNEWTRGEDRVAYSAVSDVLYAVADAKAEEVLSREEATARGHQLEEPVLRITLATEDSSESLALYPSVEGLSAATREGRDAVLLLASEAVEEVTSKLADLRAAEAESDEEAAPGDTGEEPE